MKYSNYAFDLDGTLIDGKGNLKDGVLELFKNIITKVDNPKVAICTGNSVQVALNALDKIKDGLKEKYNLGFNGVRVAVSGFGGGVVIDDGNVINNKGIMATKFHEIRELVNIIDKDAYIFLNTKNGVYFVCDKPSFKLQLMEQLLKLREKISPKLDIQLHEIDKYEYYKLIENKKVRSLGILSLNKGMNNAIFKLLSKDLKNLTVCRDDRHIEIFNGSKTESLRMVFGNDLSNVVYIGDGLNDMKAMRSCGLSFALGNNVQVLGCADYPIESLKDANNIVFDSLFNDKEEQIKSDKVRSQKILRDAQDANLKKLEKKERGQVHYAVKIIGEKLSRENDDD